MFCQAVRPPAALASYSAITDKLYHRHTQSLPPHMVQPPFCSTPADAPHVPALLADVAALARAQWLEIRHVDRG
jgi:hypothetical protein